MIDASSRVLNRALLLAVIAATASSVQALPTITNGDFEQNANVQSTDVAGWFNYIGADPGAWWLSAWQGPVVSFNGTTIFGMSGDSGVHAWAYQNVGRNDTGLSTVKLQFDLGEFTDAGETRDLGVKVDLYQSNGTFVGADNTDIVGASGITLIDSISTTSGALSAGDSVRKVLQFNLASANTTGDLFVRFSNFNGGTGAGDPWTQIDNIKFLTGPIHTPVDISYVGAAAGGTWDNGTTSSFNAASGTVSFGEGDRPTFGNTGAVDPGTGASIVNIVGTVEPGNVVIDSNHNYLFQGTGAVQGLSGATLVKRGAGKATFTGGGNYPGGVTIEAGTIELTGLTNGNTHGIRGGAIVNNGTIILNRQYVNATDINEWNPLPLEQTISGTGGIVIQNHAILGKRGDPSSVNSFTGPVTIAGGFTYLGNANGLGSPATGTTILSGATLAVVDEWHLGANAVISEPLTLNGFGVTSWFNGGFPTGALFQWEGTRTFTGAINLATTSSVVVRQDPNTVTTNPTKMIWTGALTAAPGAGLQKEGDGMLIYKGGTLDSLVVYGGKLQQTGGTTKVKTLYLEAGTNLDLTGSALAVDYDGTATAYADLQSKMADGRLTTSLDPNKYVLGIVENATMATPIASVLGTPVDSSTVIVRGTLRGDSDLSGTVGFNDLLVLAQNYGGSSKLYQQGDTNYSGIVDFTDLLALAQNYGQATPTDAQAAQLGADFMADFALAQSLVPEPMSLSLVAAGSLLLAGRRRRLE